MHANSATVNSNLLECYYRANCAFRRCNPFAINTEGEETPDACGDIRSVIGYIGEIASPTAAVTQCRVLPCASESAFSILILLLTLVIDHTLIFSLPNKGSPFTLILNLF